MRRGSREFEEIEALNSLLTRITPSDINQLAKHVLGNSEKIELASKYAYSHTNGFKKITLLKTDNLCLRIHLWNSGDLQAENIHSHRWPFVSRVIVGEMEETRYGLAHQGKTATEYNYLGTSNGGTRDLLLNKTVTLRKLDQFLHEETSQYSMQTSELHQVLERPRDQRLVSLMMTGRPTANNSRVYGFEGFPPAQDRPNNGLSVEETKIALTDIVQLMKII